MDNLSAQMKFEMELRGYSKETQKHYLSHVRLQLIDRPVRGGGKCALF